MTNLPRPVFDQNFQWLGLQVKNWQLLEVADEYQPEAIDRCFQLKG